jgi:hypothetical protein
MMQEIQAHKNNRDWHLDSSSSNNTMSDDEDRKPSAVNRLDNHTRNNNNEGLNLDDFVETEDYEPTDPDGFNQQIIIIFGSNHDDLRSTTATAVNSIMACWGTHMYCWYCYNCNQQLLNTSHGDVWECPTCIYLDISKSNNATHWDFGVCECCENIGPADMTCVTCLIRQHGYLPSIKEGFHHLQGGTQTVHQERIRNLGKLLSLFGRTVLRGGHLEQIAVVRVL